MVKRYNLFLESNQYESEYVIGVPSGEIIYVKTTDNLTTLIRNDVVKFENRVNNKIVNCYCFNDDKRYLVIKYLENSFDNKMPQDKRNICVDFQDEILNVIGKRVAIGYTSKIGYSYYYAIIPDLIMNKRFYDIKKEKLESVINKMKRKYLFSYFYYKERMIDIDLKYYM